MENNQGLNIPAKQLSQKRRLFAEAYAGDEVEAMQLAGYQGDPNYLRQKAQQLLKDPLVMEAIKDRSKYTATTKEAIWNREERQVFWTQVAKNKDPYARQELDKFGNPIPEEHKPNIPIQQRLKATEMLGKSEGDFVDRIDMNTNISLQQIIMNSYELPPSDDMSIEEIEAEYRKVRDARRLTENKDEEEEIEDAEFEESEDSDSGYSFI
jgi:phage terminase small subunit